MYTTPVMFCSIRAERTYSKLTSVMSAAHNSWMHLQKEYEIRGGLAVLC